MDSKVYLWCLFLLFVINNVNLVYGLQRCFQCRSRGELGSCKDPFTANVTLIENKQIAGIETIPCASGWCGKTVESSEDALKEEYGVATHRLCLQRGPSDGEDRCAYTKWNHQRVFMCFCKGDLCNSSFRVSFNVVTLFVVFISGFYLA